MSPNPLTPGPVRSASAVNEQIRSLWLRAGGHLTTDQRVEYERLVTEWAAAVRAEVVRAA
ncbi:hypothetical protein [Streptomyces tsukubensis]|uniref:Uncharacterized protein n=1 Tax=Streptomyces tsukubensis TaxID=83656 RepID=A0A1V4A696_9ACTN|nr:hypothetical protein [Streptomyces tsukubensis]OON77361.1 hypothetical protein B1H18_19195 [Streptomyces tsukubensis]QFR92444.1 hypothetical protein GBW32_04420 [Streptomyces tsukubensis]